MYPFVDVISGLERRSRRHRVYSALLNCIALFLLGYALLLYISAPVIFARYGSYDFVLFDYPVRMKLLGTAAIALVPAIILTILLRRRPMNVIKRIEARYPAFKDRLPTAYDNRGAGGIIASDLLLNVSNHISTVKKSAIIKRTGLLLLIAAIAGEAALVTFISSPDAPRLVTPEELEAMFPPVDAAGRDAAEDEAHYQQIMTELGSDSSEGEGDADIYGKPSVAVIEGTNIELVMFSDGGVGSSSRRSDDELRKFTSGSAPAANPVSAETYIDKLPEEHRDVIRQYFVRMAEIE